MTGTELTAIVRDYIKDEVTPYLWSDATILRHLRKAERELCERTHVLIDPAVTFNTVAATNTYTMADNVLRVYAVRVAANTKPLGRLRGRSYGIHMQDTSGEPTVFSTELAPKSVTLYPSPDDEYAMEAICATTPETPLSAILDTVLDDEQAEELANYAAYRCLITNDVDGERVGTANEFRDLWEEYVSELKREIYRYRTGDNLVMQNWTHGYNRASTNILVGN